MIQIRLFVGVLLFFSFFKKNFSKDVGKHLLYSAFLGEHIFFEERLANQRFHYFIKEITKIIVQQDNFVCQGLCYNALDGTAQFSEFQLSADAYQMQLFSGVSQILLYENFPKDAGKKLLQSAFLPEYAFFGESLGQKFEKMDCPKSVKINMQGCYETFLALKNCAKSIFVQCCFLDVENTVLYRLNSYINLPSR